jgi:hypothetical protein
MCKRKRPMQGTASSFYLEGGAHVASSESEELIQKSYLILDTGT